MQILICNTFKQNHISIHCSCMFVHPCMNDFYHASSLFRDEGQWQAKQVNRKGKYFHSCGQSRVTGTKSVDLTMTSETVRPSYITKPLHFSQGRRGNRMNKLRGPSEDTRRRLFLSSEGALLRMKWFFPRVIEGQVGATYLSA